MAKWRLGLDLGTNSIGWSVLSIDSDNEITGELIDMGVRVFPDGREPKTGEPLAVARRTARGIRKNLLRRKLRRRQLFRFLKSGKLFPDNIGEAQNVKLLNPYELRVKALDTKLAPYELGRVLFNIGVRRGFKSNRKDNTEKTEQKETETENAAAVNPEKMTQKEKCMHLEAAIQDSGCRTLGEFLWKNREKNAGIRFVPSRTYFYPLRNLYENEFSLIRSVQEPFYPDIHWDEIYKIIFFQRPLKAQERGRCQFMPEKERTFKAMPCSQKYRILQEVYNLEWYDELNQPHDLTPDDQKKVINVLDTTKELTFDKIRKLLALTDCIRFNLESEMRNKLNGNTTAVILRNSKRFGSLWDSFLLEEQDSIVEKLITADEDTEVFSMLEKYNGLSDEQKKNIVNVSFTSGTTSFCKELTEKLVDIMQDKHLQFDLALMLLGYSHSEETVAHYDLLPYYGKVLTGSTMGIKDDAPENKPELKYGKISNPTVHVALNQLRVVVNSLIKRYGKPSQIVVEVARELKASREDKEAMRIANGKHAKENQILNKTLIDAYNIQYPNRLQRQKYRLWQELGAEGMPRRCLYCGENIPAAELFTKNIEIEHILPFSRTLLNADSNLTIAHAHCNAKKAEHTPYEAFGSVASGPYAWENIMQRVGMLHNRIKQGRFAPDAMQNFEKQASFIDRQLTDNAYLSKIARRYLTSITEKNTDVWTVAGGATKLMRDTWEIDNILKRRIDSKEAALLGLKEGEIGTYKKNRYDHRHHALDSVVIGLTDRSIVQQIAIKNAKKQKDRIEMPEMPISRQELINAVKNIVPSFKPDHGVEGKLSKETLLGCIKQETLLPIEQLTFEDIGNIKIPEVQEEFEEIVADQKDDLKKAIKILKEKYPQVKVFRKQFVARMPLISLKDKKNIEDIVDVSIREKLRVFSEQNQDIKWEQILQDFSNKMKIKKIRCKTFVQNPIIIHPDSLNPHKPTRYLNPEDYYSVIIWKLPPAADKQLFKYQGQFVMRTDVDNKNNPIENKPHPAAKKECLLYKNDYIEFSENGIWKKARIAGFSATRNQIDIRPVYATQDAETWIIATNESMLEKGWKKQKDQCYVSINVLFGSMSACKITVDPIGKVHRLK